VRVDRHHLLLGRASAAAAVLLLCASCGSGGSCAKAAPAASTCADLSFRGHPYDEWREVKVSGFVQELGDGVYPACNTAGSCDRSDPGGFGATDVLLLDGVDPTQAVIGLRENSDTHVIFVRVGVDPDTLHPLAGSP
jgi:hypothetical protein